MRIFFIHNFMFLVFRTYLLSILFVVLQYGITSIHRVVIILLYPNIERNYYIIITYHHIRYINAYL